MENMTNDATETSTPSAPRARRSRKMAKAKASRIVTATLEQRQMRVVFKQGSKVVATSPVYRTRNIVNKVIAYARQTLKPAQPSVATAQVLDGKSWKNVKAV